MGLGEDMKQDIQKGECQEIEFMERFPSKAHELAKEIAAFATSNPGTIYIGISDNGKKTGISNNPAKFKDVKDNIVYYDLFLCIHFF